MTESPDRTVGARDCDDRPLRRAGEGDPLKDESPPSLLGTDATPGPGSAPRSKSGLKRFFRRHVRPLFSRRLSQLGAMMLPPLYMLYMRFVWGTSRVVDGRAFLRLNEIAAEYNGTVALLWHEEVMTVAYGYGAYLGLRGHTLASVGDAGELIARLLARCNFVVFRGGSTTGRSRRREGTLQEMIEHMRTTDLVIYGLTVDGSKGPAYRIKTGGIIIARECGKPIALVRTWYRRCIRLRTWDRMAIPLPFNEIRYYIRGPYHVPASASTPEGLHEFLLTLEDDLIDIAAASYDDLGQPRPVNLVKRPRPPGRITQPVDGPAVHLGNEPHNP